MLEVFTFIIAIILVILPFFDWTATYILRKATKRGGYVPIALQERAKVAIILATITSINGLFGVIRLFGLHLSPVIITIALAASFLLSSLPNIYWLYLYFKNRFRK